MSARRPALALALLVTTAALGAGCGGSEPNPSRSDGSAAGGAGGAGGARAGGTGGGPAAGTDAALDGAVDTIGTDGDGGTSDADAASGGADAPLSDGRPSDGTASDGVAPAIDIAAGDTADAGVETAADAPSDAGTPTFAVVRAIFTRRFCVACHAGEGAMLPAVMDVRNHAHLTADSLQCVGMGGRKRVKPGDAANSYLAHKIRGINLCAGQRMPRGGVPVPEDEIALIEAWINGGAPAN